MNIDGLNLIFFIINHLCRGGGITLHNSVLKICILSIDRSDYYKVIKNHFPLKSLLDLLLNAGKKRNIYFLLIFLKSEYVGYLIINYKF